MKKKRLKQKKIVVLSCFKFCWDSFLILWKTPSFSPHCCWNYYLLLYILLREKRKKSGRGNHISFQATPICWFYDARCWKKKKRFLLCAPTLIACFKVLRHNTKTNKQTKTTMLRKRKKAVFKTAIVIVVKKIMKIRKIDWNLLTRKKRKQKQTRTRKNKTNNPCFTTFFLFIKFGHDDERKQKNCYHYYRYNNTQINYYTL